MPRGKLLFVGFLVVMVLLGLLFWLIVSQPSRPEKTTMRVISPSALPTKVPDKTWDKLNYIDTVDWPPVIKTEISKYSCTNSKDSSVARAGKTMERNIEGRTYCVTEVSEGAAGSIYIQYAYATKIGNEVRTMTFSVRQVQCGNYPDPQLTECQHERSTFNVDDYIKTELAQLETLTPTTRPQTK